jgi:hypothetical protein
MDFFNQAAVFGRIADGNVGRVLSFLSGVYAKSTPPVPVFQAGVTGRSQ